MANTTGSSHPKNAKTSARAQRGARVLGPFATGGRDRVEPTAHCRFDDGEWSAWRGVTRIEGTSQVVPAAVCYFTGEDEEVVRVWVWCGRGHAGQAGREALDQDRGNSFVLVSS